MKIAIIVAGLIIPFYLGNYPIGLTLFYFVLLVVGVLVSLISARKKLLAFILLLVFSIIGAFIYKKTVEMKLVKIGEKLDRYRFKEKSYPKRLVELNVVVPSYYGQKPLFYSTSTYFVFKYQSKGVFGSDFGFTSSNRKLGNKKQGWDG